MHWRYPLQYRIEQLAQSRDISLGKSSGVTVGDYLGMLRGKFRHDGRGLSTDVRGKGLAFRLAGEAWVYCKGDSLTKVGTNHSHRLSHVKVATPSSILGERLHHGR